MDGIDLTAFFPTIREAARAQGSVAWFGWLSGVVLTALGVWGSALLLALGLALLVAMTIWTVRHVRKQRFYHRLGDQDGDAPGAPPPS